jgi:hypothetical protein
MESLTPDGAADLLLRDDQAQQFVAGFAKGEGARRREQMVAWAEKFREDRSWATVQGWSEQEKEAHLAGHRTADLRERASEAHRALQQDLDTEYLQAITRDGLASDPGPAVDSFVGLIDTEPTALPAWRIGNAFVDGFAAIAARRKPGSKGQRELGSSFFDYVHAYVGGAYCDVFTCDGQVFDAIAEQRTRLGLPAPLTANGMTAQAFVAALMSTWPVTRTRVPE